MNNKKDKKLLGIYKILLGKLGRQWLWPTISKSKNHQDKKFEICIGAILTQNTNWQNVEKALKNLDKKGLLNEKSIKNIPQKRLAPLIKPIGYYKKKAEKLKAFLSFLEKYPLDKIEKMQTEEARSLLLEVHGIGNETADSILLYAFNKPIFMIDAYTKRIFERISNLNFRTYEGWQEFFMKNLPHKAEFFNEYHALLVRLGKDFCKTKPICEKCPLIGFCSYKVH